MREFVAYVALNARGTVSRVALASALWPTRPLSKGRRALSQTAWRLSNALDPLVLVTTDSDTLSLNRHVQVRCDASRLLDTAGQLRRGETVDRADVLSLVPELEGQVLLPDIDSEWVDVERARLSSATVDVLSWLVRTAKGAGDHDESLAMARRLARVDPLSEPAHREVIRLLASAGRHDEAMRHFNDDCMGALDRAGLYPSETTLGLVAAIRIDRQHGAMGTLHESIDPNIRAVADAVARGDHQPTVLVASSPQHAHQLIDRAKAAAHVRGLDLLDIARVTGRMPYASLSAALEPYLSPIRIRALPAAMGRPWLAAAAEAIPDLGTHGKPATLDAGEERQRLREALRRLLSAVFGERPFLVVVDDTADAVDIETVATIANLVRQRSPGGAGVLVVTDHAGSPLAAEIQRGEAPIAVLTADPHAITINAESHDAQGSTPGAPSPLSASDSIIATVAALTGPSVRPDTIARLAQAPLADVHRVLDSLGNQQLLAEGMWLDEDARNEMCENVEDLDLLGRVGRDLALDPASAATGAAVLERAGHFAEAVTAWREAARTAQAAHAYRTAAAHLATAVRVQTLGELDDEDRIHLLHEYLAALDVTRDETTTLMVLDELNELAATPDEHAQNLTRRARLHTGAGLFDEAVVAAESALAVAESDTVRGEAQRWLGAARVWGSGDTTQGVDDLREAVSKLRGHRHLEALVMLGVALRAAHHVDESIDVLNASIATARELDSRHQEARALGNISGCYLYVHDLKRAEDAARSCYLVSHDIAFVNGIVIGSLNLSIVELALGRIAESVRLITEARTTALAIGDRRVASLALLNESHLRHNYLGQNARALRQAIAALDYLKPLGIEMRVVALHDTMASIALEAADHDTAIELLSVHPVAAGEYVSDEACYTIVGTVAATGDFTVGDALGRFPSSPMVHVARAAVAALADDPVAVAEWLGKIDRPFAPHYVGLVRLQYLVLLFDAYNAIDEGETAAPFLRRHLHQFLDSVDAPLRETVAARPLVQRARDATHGREDDVFVKWPATSAPTGRPRTSDDLIDVPVTGIVSVGVRASQLDALVRRAQVAGASPSVADLASVLGVSDATVRRDLASLRSQGHDIRTRGNNCTTS